MQKKVQKQLEDQAAQMATTLKRQKEAWAAAEKVRREAWQEEKTARIKELTIKGLQPELQKVIDKAKSDLHAAHEQAAEVLFTVLHWPSSMLPIEAYTILLVTLISNYRF